MDELGAFQRTLGRALLAEPDAGEESLAHCGVALRIHRNTATKGLVDALASNYPTVHQLVGDEWFKASAIAYARSHPPRSPVLALYGESFPAFLTELGPATELPYLHEVAAIDRMWIEALTAPDAAPLRPSSLASLRSSTLAELRITLHPATRLAWVQHSAATIWIHHRRTTRPETIDIADASEGIVLTRRRTDIEYTILSYASFVFLKSLQDGATLALAATTALETDADTDLAGVLARCISAGAFADFPENPS